MKGTRELCQALADYLEQQKLSAVTAWGEGRRLRPGKAVAAVSLKGLESGPQGFQDYLGERYDTSTGCWEEQYGKRVKLVFGLDLSGATSEDVRQGLYALSAALGQGGPAGLRPVAFQAGETAYEPEAKRYVCPAQAEFAAWMVGTSREEGTFLDFEVRGESGT